MKTILFILSLSLVCVQSVSYAQPVIVRPPTQPIPVDLPQSSVCRQACVNGAMNLTFMTHASVSGTRACPERTSFQVSCAPYNCDNNGKGCLVQCQQNSDCASGYFCNASAGKCMPLSYYCADANTVAGTDGSVGNCSPFICQAGRCKEFCATTMDCAGRFVCDTSTRVCVVP